MNMGINKQFIKLEGKEIIAYTIEKFYIYLSLSITFIVSLTGTPTTTAL